MSIRLPPNGPVMYGGARDRHGALDLARWWKRHWLPATIIIVAAIASLGILLAAARCACNEGHCRYLAKISTLTTVGRA